MSRFAKTGRVFFFEEPIFEDGKAVLRSTVCPKTGVRVLTPVLPHDSTHDEIVNWQKQFLGSVLSENNVRDYVAWYYTPMAREFTRDLRPAATVYDCMDELSCFAGAPSAMRINELRLLEDADLVFTGGASLFKSKRMQHPSVYLFPSSVDIAHFARATIIEREPDDQAHLPLPRLGYAGVIDERMDLELIRDVAADRPEWHIVLIGPVVKIDPASLPRAKNIHYLGMKQYSELPAYFSGWQIGMLPFALNEATRFISPTKTPEYLAAGLQVISTPIRDVVSPYGEKELVGIAGDSKDFSRIADSFLAHPPDNAFRARVSEFLETSSWDKTWRAMNRLVNQVIHSADAGSVSLQQAVSESVAHV